MRYFGKEEHVLGWVCLVWLEIGVGDGSPGCEYGHCTHLHKYFRVVKRTEDLSGMPCVQLVNYCTASHPPNDPKRNPLRGCVMWVLGVPRKAYAISFCGFFGAFNPDRCDRCFSWGKTSRGPFFPERVLEGSREVRGLSQKATTMI